jgi:hypothetical protein
MTPDLVNLPFPPKTPSSCFQHKISSPRIFKITISGMPSISGLLLAVGQSARSKLNNQRHKKRHLPASGHKASCSHVAKDKQQNKSSLLPVNAAKDITSLLVNNSGACCEATVLSSSIVVVVYKPARPCAYTILCAGQGGGGDNTRSSKIADSPKNTKFLLPQNQFTRHIQNHCKWHAYSLESACHYKYHFLVY